MLVPEDIFSYMSLINNIKSRGPSIDPWGTPDLTDSILEDLLDKTTRCYLLER